MVSENYGGWMEYIFGYVYIDLFICVCLCVYVTVHMHLKVCLSVYVPIYIVHVFVKTLFVCLWAFGTCLHLFVYVLVEACVYATSGVCVCVCLLSRGSVLVSFSLLCFTVAGISSTSVFIFVSLFSGYLFIIPNK